MPVRWFIVDAGAIRDIDYSAAQSMRDWLDDLARQRVGMVLARVSRHLQSDMDRHHITAAIGETRIFTTLQETIAAVRAAARFGGTRLRPERRRHCSAVRSSVQAARFLTLRYRGPQYGLVRPS
jgi:hypothetical protein